MVNPKELILQETRKLYEAMYLFDVKAAKLLGIHVTDLRAVNALEKGPLSPGELSDRLGLTSGSVTTLIGRLEKAGFAQKKKGDVDSRRVEVILKPVFYNKAGVVYGRLGRALQTEFDDIPENDKKSAAEALAKITKGFLKAT